MLYRLNRVYNLGMRPTTVNMAGLVSMVPVKGGPRDGGPLKSVIPVHVLMSESGLQQLWGMYGFPG